MEKIIKKLINAISIFIDNEKFLLENELNERTITHKLAIYIEKEFSEYDVDCEYNKMIKWYSQEELITKKLKLPKKGISSDDLKATVVYPDIIIHKRWNNDDNFLIIEVKKEDYANDDYNDDMTYKKFDKIKIKAYMKDLNYQYWLYLEFNWTSYIWNFYYKEKVEILSINLPL